GADHLDGGLEPVLGALAGGDVAGDPLDADDLATLVANGDGALLGPDHAAVAANPAQPHGVVGRVGRVHGLEEVTVVGMDQAPGQLRVGVVLLGRVAGHPRAGGADVLEA